MSSTQGIFLCPGFCFCFLFLNSYSFLVPLSLSIGVDMGESDSSAQGRVTIYSIQGCPHCVQAKASLGRLSVPVREVDLGRHPELRAAVKELTGRSTVPQIFFNRVHVGGNDDLQKLVRRGGGVDSVGGLFT